MNIMASILEQQQHLKQTIPSPASVGRPNWVQIYCGHHLRQLVGTAAAAAEEGIQRLL